MFINELSKHLGITIHTIRLWEKVFSLNIKRDNKNNRLYDEETLNIFEKIKKLKDEGKSTEIIKKAISDDIKSNVDIHVDVCKNTYISTSDIRTIIKTEIEEHNELSEKYARATYTIGQQEQKIKSLEEKIKLLPAPEEIYKLESENKSVKEKLEAQNEMLKEEKERLLVTINEFDKVKEENITIKQKLSLFPEPEVFNQIKQEKEHLVNENLILQRHVQKLLDEVDYHKLSWWDKLCLKLNKNRKMVVHKVNVEAC